MNVCLRWNCVVYTTCLRMLHFHFDITILPDNKPHWIFAYVNERMLYIYISNASLTIFFIWNVLNNGWNLQLRRFVMESTKGKKKPELSMMIGLLISKDCYPVIIPYRRRSTGPNITKPKRHLFLFTNKIGKVKTLTRTSFVVILCHPERTYTLTHNLI